MTQGLARSMLFRTEGSSNDIHSDAFTVQDAYVSQVIAKATNIMGVYRAGACRLLATIKKLVIIKFMSIAALFMTL